MAVATADSAAASATTMKMGGSSSRPGSARGLGVEVLEVLFVKRRDEEEDDDDEDNEKEEEEEGSSFWHLLSPSSCSPLPEEAPASFSSCFTSKARDSQQQHQLVDVAARVSDGAGGELWLASCLLLRA